MLTDLIIQLIERLLQIVKLQKIGRHDLFSNFVDPAFSEFEKLHLEYLQSFSKYREVLKATNEPLTPFHSIFDLIQRDIVFSATQRARVAELVEISEKNIAHRFISSIFTYIWWLSNSIFETNDERRIELFRRLSQVHAYPGGNDDLEKTLEFYKHEVEGATDEYRMLALSYWNQEIPNGWYKIYKTHKYGQDFERFEANGNIYRSTLVSHLGELFHWSNLDENKKKVAAIAAIDVLTEEIQKNYIPVLHEYQDLKKSFCYSLLISCFSES